MDKQQRASCESKIQTIDIGQWFDILNWKKLPEFGLVHNIEDYKKFVSLYATSKELDVFTTNLLRSVITEDQQKHNMLILGDPGVGKTSFVYWLKKEAQNNPKFSELKKFVFEIVHLNKVQHSETNKLDVSLVQDRLLKAWVRFFEENGLSKIGLDIISKESSKRYKLNLFTDFYLENYSKFTKTLIIVLDDVDQLEGELVKDIAQEVTKQIQVAKVKKWLMVRPKVFEAYNEEAKNALVDFFNDRRIFPKLSFFEIVKKRISSSSDSEEPKNPFSQNLCEIMVDNIYEGNLRDALSMLDKILAHTPTTAMEGKSEQFIQEFVDKNAVNAYVAENCLPNIYLNKNRSIQFLPLELEILKVIAHHNKANDRFTSLINYILMLKGNKTKELMGEPDGVVRVTSEDIEDAIENLQKLKLIKKIGKQIEFTGKGIIMARHATGLNYVAQMKKQMGLPDNIHEKDLYWAFVNIKIKKYEDIVKSYFVWPERKITKNV